jgi:hypothetical protein
MSSVRRVRRWAATIAAAAMGTAVLIGHASSAQAAPPPARAGYANVTDQNSPGLNPVPEAVTSANLGVHVDHVAGGAYQVQFHGLGKDALGNNLPLGTVPDGVVHVRNSEDLAYCAPGTPFAQNGDVRVTVDCVDVVAPHPHRNALFSVFYGNGVAEEGAMSSARFSGTSVSWQRSSVPGTVAVDHTGGGRYTVRMPLLNTTKAPAFAVTATKLAGPVCAFDGPSSVVDGMRWIGVQCFEPLTKNPIDTGFNISYTEGAGPLGLMSTSNAYVSVPALPDFAEHTPAAQSGRIYGDSNGVMTATRQSAGEILVRLGDQGEGINGEGVAIATASGSSAWCQVQQLATQKNPVTGQFDKFLRVRCMGNTGPASVPFELQWMGRQ